MTTESLLGLFLALACSAVVFVGPFAVVALARALRRDGQPLAAQDWLDGRSWSEPHGPIAGLSRRTH